MTEFQKYLAGRGIKHIPSRRNNPQTNGKFERWIEEYKKHRDKFESDLEFVDWYNDRLHGALKLEWAETPNEAFIRKLRQRYTWACSSRMLRLYEAKRREQQ